MAGYMRDLGNGKFQFEVSHGRDAKGKRKKAYKTVTITGSTPEAIQKKAEKALAVFIGEVEKGEHRKPTHYTFNQYVDKWRKKTSRELAPKTYYRYNELLNLHIIPHIGQYKLEEINPVILEGLYDELRNPIKRTYTLKDGTEKEKVYTLSEHTIKHIHRLIGTILQTAFRKGLIKENPITRTDAPKVKKAEPNAYDEEQITKLIEALESTDIQFKTAIHITLASGLRLGELIGLEWQDIDYTNSTITIRQSGQYLPDRGIFTKDPKNDTSKRTLSMPSPVMGIIRELEHEKKLLKIKLGSKWEGGTFKGEKEYDASSKPNRLFTQANGSPIFPDTISKQWRSFRKANGFPELTFHGLRHTSASYLIACGQDVVSVSKRLGHADSNTTLSIYAHAFKKRDQEAAEHMDKLYSKNESSKEDKVE